MTLRGLVELGLSAAPLKRPWQTGRVLLSRSCWPPLGLMRLGGHHRSNRAGLDVAEACQGSRLYGLVGAVFRAGFVVGPARGGFLGGFSLRLPFIVASLLALANFAFGLFVLPGSLPPERHRAMDWTRANPFHRIVQIFRDPPLRRLAVSWSCTWTGLGAVQSCLVLFTGYRFGRGPMLNGLMLAGVGLLQAVVEGLLLSHVTGRVGEPQ